MAQTEEDVDKGEDGSVEGDDRDKEGERGGGLLAISLTPLGEEETAGLVLKPDAGVKSMGQRKGDAEVRLWDPQAESDGRVYAGETVSTYKPSVR